MLGGHSLYKVTSLPGVGTSLPGVGIVVVQQDAKVVALVRTYQGSRTVGSDW